MADSLTSINNNTPLAAAQTQRAREHPRRPPCTVAGLPGKVHAVFAGELAPVFMIPREDFISAPRGYSPAASAGKKSSVAAATGRPFELCRGFATHGVCAAARDCPHFHAVLSRAVAHAPHIRDAAPAYPPSDFFDATQLVPAQRTVPVFTSVADGPHITSAHMVGTDDSSLEWVPIARCLKTLAPLEKWAEHASQSADYLSAAHIGEAEKRDDGDKCPATERPLSEVASSHCAHWVHAGYCHFGASCRFVHVLDPPGHYLIRRDAGRTGGRLENAALAAVPATPTDPDVSTLDSPLAGGDDSGSLQSVVVDDASSPADSGDATQRRKPKQHQLRHGTAQPVGALPAALLGYSLDALAVAGCSSARTPPPSLSLLESSRGVPSLPAANRSPEAIQSPALITGSSAGAPPDRKRRGRSPHSALHAEPSCSPPPPPPAKAAALTTLPMAGPHTVDDGLDSAAKKNAAPAVSSTTPPRAYPFAHHPYRGRPI